MSAIDKSFGSVSALSAAYLEIMPAEVMALVGQNGAGKSTMIKILNGAFRLDRGSIQFDGKPWAAGSPQQAQRAGVSTIFQEINLIAYRTVAENIYLGRELQRGTVYVSGPGGPWIGDALKPCCFNDLATTSTSILRLQKMMALVQASASALISARRVARFSAKLRSLRDGVN